MGLKKIIKEGIAIGSLSLLLSCVESKEMQEYGYKHLSSTKIKYRDGHVSEAIYSKGEMSEIYITNVPYQGDPKSRIPKIIIDKKLAPDMFEEKLADIFTDYNNI